MMFGLARLRQLAGDVTGRISGDDRRLWSSRRGRRLMRLALAVEELEERAVPTLLGQQLFPADNPWNQNIANAPVAANSAAVIANIGASVKVHPDWGADSPTSGSPLYGIPVNVVHGNSTAKVNVIIDNYPGESDVVPVPIPANAVIEGDFQNGPNTAGGGYNSGQRGDSHLIVWDEDNNVAYELYGVSRPNDPTLFPNTSGVELTKTDTAWHAAQETVWNMNTDTFSTLGATSADAAGLSILAGLARPDEALPVSQGGQGVINHALRVTLPKGDVDPQYVYPASHEVSATQASNHVPLGTRLRLANNATVNALIANMPPESKAIAVAMQQYGLIVADLGSAMYVTGASATIDTVDSPNLDLTWNLNDIFASNGLEALTAGDFQVVSLTPVVTGLSATSAAPGSTITVTGQNFSGAAGHLSVLFGSTPATSVKVLSDTQLSVVVPNGSGTVDVTVQSGVQEADTISSNPNANATAPVWGYGTSATSSADRFTFGTVTVSLVSISVTPANPSVVAGGGVVFTATGTFSDNSTSVLTSGVTWSSSNMADATVDGSGNAKALAAGTVTIMATDGGVSGSTTLTVAPAPVLPAVTGVSPASGPAKGGTKVTITGTGFTGATAVDFGTQAASFTVVSATQITATAPAGTAGQAVDVTITTANGTSAKGSADRFTYVAAPTITTQPAAVTVGTGQTATLTVVASGAGTLHYQWQKLVKRSWVNVSSANTPGASGATSSTLTITAAVTGDAGSFRVVVSNAGGSVTSNRATLTVSTTAAATVTRSPQGQTVAVGSSLTPTTAGASAGAGWTAYAIAAAAGVSGDRYQAVVTNSRGPATTAVAAPTVTTGSTPGNGPLLAPGVGQTVTGVTVMPGSYKHLLAGAKIVHTTNDREGSAGGDLQVKGLRRGD
jgi:hypothetical protein